jgi:hypothetical protein
MEPEFAPGEWATCHSLEHLVQYELIAVDGADVFITEFDAETTSRANTAPSHPALDVIARELIARVSALR